MKKLVPLLVGLSLLLGANLRAGVLVFWDRNGAAAGSGGPAPTGTWNIDALNWNTNVDGTIGTQKWGDGDYAVFAAGSDATGSYTVLVSNLVQVGDIHVDSGTVTFAPDPVAGGMLRLVAWEGAFPNTFLDNTTNRLLSVGHKDPNCTAIYNVVLTNAVGITRYKRGTLVLGVTNKFTGALTIEGGVVKLGVPYAMPTVCQLVLANNDPSRSDFNAAWQFTPAVFDTGGFSQKLDTLQLAGSDSTVLRILDFGNGASALAFADSSALDWGPFTLTITNYTMKVDSLRFGTSASGLTAQQLSQINFVEYESLPAQIDGQGFVTPNLPIIKTIHRTGSNVDLVWTAVDGRAYRCQYKDALTDPGWTDLAPDVAGSGGTCNITDTSASGGHRYYRVMVLPP